MTKTSEYVLPAILSFAGDGSARLSTFVVRRMPFLATSIVLLAWSMYTNVRRGDWWLNRFLTLVAGVIAFSFSAGWII